MKTESIRILNGANIYREQPVFVARLDLEESEHQQSRELTGFNQRLVESLPFYFDHGGSPGKLTISTDASTTGPQNLFEQIGVCLIEHKFPIQQVLACVTANPARALKLPATGTLETGKSADLLVLEKETFELCEVIVNGKRLFKNGKIAFKESFKKDSNRQLSLKGDKELK